MTKIKVGDDVVLSGPARVTGLNGYNANLVFESGGAFDIPIAALVTASPAQAHGKIQKGDKFRVSRDDILGDYANGDVFEAADVTGSTVYFYDNAVDYRSISADDITLVDDHGEPWDYKPSLKIEAGKFYRTRDGRKVGPVRESDNNAGEPYQFRCGNWYVTEGGTVNLGMGFDEKCDLIAEWADDEPKFKVGDRVRVVVGEDEAESGHGAEIGEEHIVEHVYSHGVQTELWFFFDEEVELVTDNDTTISVKITADTSDLDEEIDRIKRRLKKLAKKARKLGIALDYDLAA